MPRFRRVEDRRAGPTALGILVPPGARTLVILRPRGLDWDLLSVRLEEEGPGAFRDFDRNEAAGVARRVQRDLEQGAGGEGGAVRALARPGGEGYWVLARAGGLEWVACYRVPGRPYQAAVFATAEGAADAARRLTAVLSPTGESTQEYYFNTQHFSAPST